LSFLRTHAGGRLARLLFWAAALFTFVMAVLPHPPDIPLHPSDKVQHMAAFATLGLLGGWAFSRSSALRLLIALSLFGAAIEVVQAIPWLHRDSELLDWVADTAAAAIVLLLVSRLRARSRVAKRGG
jgi:VanZ family protein